MKNGILPIVFLIALSPNSRESRIDSARLSLKKWGLAYCISSQSSDASMKKDADLAMGGYFELGGHNDAAAYKLVKAFFDARIREDKRTSKISGKKILLAACLDAYEMHAYDSLIAQQDKYIEAQP